jgi:hypothetical protein
VTTSTLQLNGLLLFQHSPGLVLCREFYSLHPLRVGELVHVVGEHLGRVVHVDDRGVWVALPEGLWVIADVFYDCGWRPYDPGPPIVTVLTVAPGGESFAIAWAASLRSVEDGSGGRVPAVFVRAVRDDRRPGVVVCEFRRVRVKAGV